MVTAEPTWLVVTAAPFLAGCVALRLLLDRRAKRHPRLDGRWQSRSAVKRLGLFR
jgi:hypothetical protein